MNLKNIFKIIFRINFSILIFLSFIKLNYALAQSDTTLETSVYSSSDNAPPIEVKTKEQEESFLFDMIQTEAKLKEEKDLIAKKFNSGLFVSPERTTMIVNSMREFGVYGGDGPYKVSLGNFGGKLTKIGGSSFVYQAPATDKDLMLKVTDMKGRTTSVFISVVVPLVVKPSAFTQFSPKSFENFEIKGGKPPYQIQQIEGKGSLENILENNFSYRASAENDSVMIKVTDSLKNEFFIPIEVKKEDSPVLVEYKSPFKEEVYSKKESESKPIETKTVESKTPENKPTEVPSTENKTAETKPAEVKADDSNRKPADETLQKEEPKKEELTPQEKSLGELLKYEPNSSPMGSEKSPETK